MKSIFLPLALTVVLSFVQLHAAFLVQPHDVVAICGDSITEQKQYSIFIEDYLLMCQPTEDMRCVEFGWSGERATGFLPRLDSDVLPFKPTVATICYGMNDGSYTKMTDDIGTTYRNALTDSVEKLKAGGVRSIVLGSPGCVDSTTYTSPPHATSAEEYNKTLDALRGIAKEVAEKEKVTFADVYTPMKEVMAKAKAAYGDTYQFAGRDGIHPDNNGHLVMAYAFLKGLGCDGAIGTITVDLDSNAATGTPGQKILSCQDGKVDVESTRYPFCFRVPPNKGEPACADVLGFFPFNADLNRYLLVVKGIKGSKAKITWGTVTKEFSSADLGKGINLAAEFLENPFCEQFNKVTGAVYAQQSNESILVKVFMHEIPRSFKIMAPNSSAEFEKISADGMAQDKNLFSAAAALVIPLHHTIKIESEP